jgi:hypothetical protein
VEEKGGLSSLASKAGKVVGEVYDSMSPLDKAALFTAPVPILGDIVGFAADGAALYDDPSLTNAGLMAAGLIPFVPSGGVTRTAQKLFTNLRNDVPGFYGTNDPVTQGISAGKTIPEGITNIARARYAPRGEYRVSIISAWLIKKRLMMLLKYLRKSLLKLLP